MKPPTADQVAQAIGGLLLAAAVLKIVDAFNSPELGVESTVAVVASVVELVIGVSLVFRFIPRIALPATGLWFVLLAGVSLLGTSRGFSSCGCLGALAAPPWALLIFDAVAAAILLWRPLTSGALRKNQALALGAACAGFLAGGLAIGSVLYPPSGTSAAGLARTIATAKVVTIEPALLRDGPFLLLPYIDIDADLSHGEWKLIMAKAGCRRCEQRLKSGECRPDGRERVAVILAGEEPGWTVPTECKAIVGHLSSGKTWMFPAPFTLRLTDGQVSGSITGH